MARARSKSFASIHPELPTPDPSLSVFINCPFDGDYEPLFDAIVFATVCCGFLPRCAMESDSVAVPRMDRIAHGIFTSNYSIHDLSRCQGEGIDMLARFNMPLELGIAMGRRYASVRRGQHHEWLVLIPDEQDYLRFVSDLGGFDPKRHDGRVETLVPRVVAWLSTRPSAILPPDLSAVKKGLEQYYAKIALLKQDWASEVPWPLVVKATQECVPRL